VRHVDARQAGTGVVEARQAVADHAVVVEAAVQVQLLQSSTADIAGQRVQVFVVQLDVPEADRLQNGTVPTNDLECVVVHFARAEKNSG